MFSLSGSELQEQKEKPKSIEIFKLETHLEKVGRSNLDTLDQKQTAVHMWLIFILTINFGLRYG